MKLAAFLLLAAGCASAPLDVQSRAVFAAETGCSTDQTEATRVASNEWDVRGCGRRSLYVCWMDTGCSGAARVRRGPSATDFPPSLVDSAPPAPPPRLKPDCKQ